MTSLDIDELEAGKELADEGDDLVGHICAPGAADEEGRLLEARLVGVLEGEVAEVAERLGQDRQRDAELLRLAALGTMEVAEQELPNAEGLLSFFSNSKTFLCVYQP